ncbi:hypothetical protein LOTGIDRAFT_231918 [Lottia gigantea]|uniref:Uncharacterized protein n=1 Tax=Lottia gigantea TaxID=225164 RepID=V4ALQ9_LOTGI|nr:hypothetical protein LOTGIDRAFT_231918 [Lottia gigantea]ESO95695.1 hypothetical protein LOTGIDRAFT_231918 [Lottia gigantea]
MSMKKDRRRVLAAIWGTPTRYHLDFFDEGAEVIITCNTPEVSNWWLETLKKKYPSVNCLEKNEIIKLKPMTNVTLKLNKEIGMLKVTGKNHWQWIVECLGDLLEEGSLEETETMVSMSSNSVSRFLQLDKLEEDIQDLLDMIPDGGGIMTHDFIMKLWKTLLNDWFGVGACVYVVTPNIDSERLFQCMLLMIRNKGTGFKCTLITPASPLHGEKFEKILEKTKRRMKEVKTPQHKRLLSDVKIQWVLDSLDVRHENFSTNFVAAYKNEEAEVLTTTAHFHKTHFHFNQRDNVCYNQLSTSDLKRNYLFPLGIGSNVI